MKKTLNIAQQILSQIWEAELGNTAKQLEIALLNALEGVFYKTDYPFGTNDQDPTELLTFEDGSILFVRNPRNVYYEFSVVEYNIAQQVLASQIWEVDGENTPEQWEIVFEKALEGFSYVRDYPYGTASSDPSQELTFEDGSTLTVGNPRNVCFDFFVHE